jgi:hypothetical protein
MSEFMKGDKKLERDLLKATTFEDLRSLLENAVERSPLGVTRDLQTGQFVRRDPLTPAAQDETEQEEIITRTETINGKAIDFKGTEDQLEALIANAYRVAEALKSELAPVTPRSIRHKTQADIEREICDRTEIDLQFKRGQLTTAEYLERTNAIGEYLESKGFDVEAAASKQFEQSWAQASEEFLRGAGSDWPGGTKNRELIGMKLASMNLIDAKDKVAALATAYADMKKSGTLFAGDVSPEEIIESTANASPQEILEAWKSTQGGDAEAANQAFIQDFSGGRFWGK